MEEQKSLAFFQGMPIRKMWLNEEWWFSVVDIVGILTGSEDPRNYWKVLKHRLAEESGNETVTNCNQLKLQAEDGKMRETDCVNTEGAFRIIQSIPSPKAEPMKLWLAKVGYERIKEIQNPELAQKRIREIYRAKGYSDEWIEKRARGIAVRDELTAEWDKRGANTEKDYAILTAEISQAAFGMTPSEYKELKGLKQENLRDHMDDMELILTMLGEAATTRLTQGRDSKEFEELEKDAKDGGEVAGTARKEIETKLGKSVVSKENYLTTPEKEKRIEAKKQRLLEKK